LGCECEIQLGVGDLAGLDENRADRSAALLLNCKSIEYVASFDESHFDQYAAELATAKLSNGGHFDLSGHKERRYCCKGCDRFV